MGTRKEIFLPKHLQGSDHKGECRRAAQNNEIKEQIQLLFYWHFGTFLCVQSKTTATSDQIIDLVENVITRQLSFLSLFETEREGNRSGKLTCMKLPTEVVQKKITI